MRDSNRTRERGRERFAQNKDAFTEVFGDPFAASEPIIGKYQTLKKRSSIMIIPPMDLTRGTKNPAQPTSVDFFIDAENAMFAALADTRSIRMFFETYIDETAAPPLEERRRIEQRVGALLIARGLYPVPRYFRTIRRKTRP